MPPFLPYGRQTIEDDDVEAVARALRADYLTTGPLVADFERAFAEGADVPRTSWEAVGSGLIDAIVGLWVAPVTKHP